MIVNTIRKAAFCLGFLLLTVAALCAQPGADSVGREDDGLLIGYILEGRIQQLHDSLRSGYWPRSSPHHQLATAVLQKNGERARQLFSDLVASPDTPAELRTVAWFNLYGYHRLQNDPVKQNEALEQLAFQDSLARRLFGGPLPPAAPVDPLDFLMQPDDGEESGGVDAAGNDPKGRFSLQLGAFSSEANAKRASARYNGLGLEVYVQPVQRNGSTLYMVRAGRFATWARARDFGADRIGEPGRDFSIVERSD